MRFDSRNWFNNQNSITTLNPQNSNETWVWDRGRLSYPQYEGNGGGYVHADNSYFINNRKDAEFLPYTFASSGSYFNSNTFSCIGPLVDPDFHYYDFFGNYSFGTYIIFLLSPIPLTILDYFNGITEEPAFPALMQIMI
jgi:hypothetical protein